MEKTMQKTAFLDYLEINGESIGFFSLKKLEDLGFPNISNLPYSIKILLEGVLRKFDGVFVREEHIRQLAEWNASSPNTELEIPLMPSSIVLQDFTGIAVATDLAALRSAMNRIGGDIKRINPLVPVDLVIDHSIQVDYFGSPDSLDKNEEIEFQRNHERFEFFKWTAEAFDNFRVVPPSFGIIHQVNLEHLSPVVGLQEQEGVKLAFPSTVLGTDSHTTMINGLGVLGWGVGGIEAEAAMLGQPVYLLTPQVVGFRLNGKLSEGTTATDLVLTITNLLRKKGVVGQFVEFFGPGVKNLSLADRATVANMAPEYGATMGFFPIDRETLNYLETTGRSSEQIALIEAYTQAQGLFREDKGEEPHYSSVLELDLAQVEPSLAGPKRPHDRMNLSQVQHNFEEVIYSPIKDGGFRLDEEELSKEVTLQLADGRETKLGTGSIVLAAITSCTNTSNPSVMVAAGLLAKKAVEKGLVTALTVKTSLGPGSVVVTEYLNRSGLMPYLEKLGFHVVGYGCTTCTGGGGALIPEVEKAIQDNNLLVSSILSGNRNFEGRIHPLIKANYLASPPLVVAYALAGTININLADEPLGYTQDKQAIYLKDIWPTEEEIQTVIKEYITPELYHATYENVFAANKRWNGLEVGAGLDYEWKEESTYIQEPPFLDNIEMEPEEPNPLLGLRSLVLLGDSITTDHISPASPISSKSSAGEYLLQHGERIEDLNTYGARRGNHEVMIRGTFANIRLRNELVPGSEGSVTNHLPTNEVMSIYEAAMKYQDENIGTMVIAGKEYGSGSSRDWAAKGTRLLGVKVVLVESFERIHRSNLVGMGVLPLQFLPGDSWKSLGITGFESFDILGLGREITPKQEVTLLATRPDKSTFSFKVIIRLDSPIEVKYYRQGGILPMMLRQFNSK